MSATDRLSAAECAESAGIAYSTWTSYVARGYAPKPDGRRSFDGAPWWHRKTLGAWLANRPGQEHAGIAQANHDAIFAAVRADPGARQVDIAERLGLSLRSVNVHLNGRCGCTRRADQVRA